MRYCDIYVIYYPDITEKPGHCGATFGVRLKLEKSPNLFFSLVLYSANKSPVVSVNLFMLYVLHHNVTAQWFHDRFFKSPGIGMLLL